MLMPSPSSSIQTSLIPRQTLLSLLQICKAPIELKQMHAGSVKTGVFYDVYVSSRILSLYSNRQTGTFKEARSVFDQIAEPSLFSWNTIIKCCVENGYFDDAIILFYELLCWSVVFADNYTFPSVIKGCTALSAIEEGEQIHGMVMKMGLQSDKYVQASLVSLYSKCRRVDHARRVFDRMDDRDTVTWNTLIDGYVKCGDINTVHELFDEMPHRDLFSWTSLINGYSKCGKVAIARRFFDQMPDKNVVSWNAMINGHIKCGDSESARLLFDQMPERNIVSWNSMICGYEKKGLFKEALMVFEAMLKEDVVPNIVTLVGALSAVSGLALLEKGRWIHMFARRGGFEFDGVLGTCLIDMYSKCGCIESALKVFQGIPKKRLGHWTAIIVGLGMHGMADLALDLFNEMQGIGMKPHPIAFVGILNACSHRGMVSEGRRYFELMTKEYDIRPMLEHYGCLVDLLCRVGHLEEARNVIETMPMKPNKVIWMSLLSGSKKHGNVKIGEYAAKHLIELAPNATGCYVLLSNIYAKANQWNGVSKLREMMRKRGVRKDPGRSSVEYGGVVHEFVVGDRHHPQTELIYSKLNEMGNKLKCTEYVPDTTQVLLCLEEKDKEAELALHSERLAIAFALINIEPGMPVRVVKNLRICSDCHNVFKLLSGIYDREIIVRDTSRFHHFRNGSCSCMDYW